MHILESIVSTLNPDGSTHIAPLGVWSDDLQHPTLAPFRPSTTLDNLLREKIAIINCTDDVRIFAGCLTGRYHHALCPAQQLPLERLADALSHRELKISSVEEDDVRPRLHCEVVYAKTHHPFLGFNRAQAAVIELAILASRLNMLETAKIASELSYLKIAMDKTAGERELEAWGWLIEKIQQHPQHGSIKDLNSL